MSDLETTGPQPISPDELTQYHVAAEIANRTVMRVASECVVGRKVLDLCVGGDKLIVSELAAVFKTGVDKGIAFPTCVSINNCIGNYSPLSGDELVLSAGDIVKIDLGVHINGHVAMVGHTTVVNPDPTRPLIGRGADVICAAHYAFEAAVRMIRPGNSSQAVTRAIGQIGEAFGCQPVQGVVTSSIAPYTLDGPRVVACHPADMPEEDFTFVENDVYIVDIAMATGDGKPRDLSVKPSVYRRDPNRRYELKLQAARQLMGEIIKHAPRMPFTVRALGNDARAALGIREAADHELLMAYPVRFARPGDQVARLRCTLLLLPTGAVRLTGCEAIPYVHSEKSISDASLNALLTSSMPVPRTAAKGKKKGGKKTNDTSMQE